MPKAGNILTNRRILVAEDNATNQLVVSRMLDILGASYDMASDGIEAIALFESNRYDLALLDIEMPRKSGLDVIRFIRESGQVDNSFPVIALTAFVLEEHRTKIMVAGASGIIPKPITDIVEFGNQIIGYCEESSSTYDQASDQEIDPNALNELQETLGSDVMCDFLSSLQVDLGSVRAELDEGATVHDIDMIEGALHKLISLASMAGGQRLLKKSKQLHGHVSAIDAEVLSTSLAEIKAGIEALLVHIQERRG